jgi:hypothetical protein
VLVVVSKSVSNSVVVPSTHRLLVVTWAKVVVDEAVLVMALEMVVVAVAVWTVVTAA